MPTLQHLSTRQIDDAIQAASAKRVPVTLTVHVAGDWVSMRGRMIGVREGHLWIALAEPAEGEKAHEFHPADKVGVSFKLKHHKHIFHGTVAAMGHAGEVDGVEAPILQVCLPTTMHRMQRRAFLRAEVPANRVVRASYWLGGCAAEPSTPSSDQPVWAGKVVDISAGGFQIISQDGGAESLEVGETIGVRISFGVGDETVFADAQFRHLQRADGQECVGFQFIGLAHSAQGRRTLQQIGTKVGQFQRELAAAQRSRA